MRRTQTYITEEQERRIAGCASDGGLAKAEVIRRILDEALGIDDGQSHRARAIVATAGLRADADDWPKWLAFVRGSGADERLRQLGT